MELCIAVHYLPKIKCICWMLYFIVLQFLHCLLLQQLSIYIKSKQDYERERSLFITSVLLTECLSCADVLVVSLSSIE